MVRSGHLYSHLNLTILVQFIFSVAPDLDGMAGTRQCGLLTSLLNELNSNAKERTIEDSCIVKGICMALGREYNIDMADRSGKQEEEEQLIDIASTLTLSEWFCDGLTSICFWSLCVQSQYDATLGYLG